MAREAFGRLRVDIEVTERNTQIGGGSDAASMIHRFLVDSVLNNGTSDGQVDRAYSEALSLTTTPTDFDVSGSIASDIGAGTVVLAEVVCVAISNTSESGDIVFGGDTNFVTITGAAAHTLAIKPGGLMLLYAPKGYAVVAGTGDILQLAASAGTVTGKMLILGRSS